MGSAKICQERAVALAARALSASAQRDAASGNGMDLAVITAKDGYVPVDQKKFQPYSRSRHHTPLTG